MRFPYGELTTPAVVVDLDAVERNVRRMAEKLSGLGIRHRPHVKTHKSVQLARLQVAAGASGITVAKLAEAEVFAKAGFQDILLAYPVVGADKLARFQALHADINLLSVVDSEVVASGLSQVGIETGRPVRVLIEIDGGMHRGGRQPGRDAVEFAASIRRLPGIQVVGLMGYFGQIYQRQPGDGLIQEARREAEALRQTAELFREAGWELEVISAGSSPSSKLGENLIGVTEVRAGNYIFNDVAALTLGLAEEADCALRVVATVVSTPVPGCATVDAGSKTLSTDRVHHREGYGWVVGHPDVSIAALNEEHGMLRYDPAATSFSVGDRVEIIPNHACVVPNLFSHVYGARGGRVVEEIRIDARGCNY